MEISAGWEFKAIVFESDPIEIAGFQPWQMTWEPVPVGSVWVAHPAHSAQQHSMTVYRLAQTRPPVFFAAGEFSNGVWGFYEPADSMRDFLLRLTE